MVSQKVVKLSPPIISSSYRRLPRRMSAFYEYVKEATLKKISGKILDIQTKAPYIVKNIIKY